MASVLFLALVVVLSLNYSLDAAAEISGDLLVWVALVVVMNLLPIKVNDVQLTLDLPLLLAVAMLHGPEAAALVAFVATIDARLVAGKNVSAWRSVFNRSQVALSVWVAGWVFSLLSPSLLPLSRSLPALAAALLADHVVNTAAVALHVAVTRGIGVRDSLRQLMEHPVHFAAIYFGYAALSLILALLAIQVGLWSVVAFLIPLAGARQLLLKGQALEGLARDLRHHERLLRQALERLEVERRDERARVAADLHDDVLQSLIHVRMLGGLVSSTLRRPGGSAAETIGAIEELTASADGAIDQLRSVIGGLSTSELDSLGLAGTLRHLLARLQREWRTEIKCSLPERLELAKEIELVIYQSVREGVLNALKHSGATCINVLLIAEPEVIQLSVEDDGRGIVRASTKPDSGRHFGLELLRSRVAAVSGELSILSSPENGTKLRVSIPLSGGGESRSSRS